MDGASHHRVDDLVLHARGFFGGRGGNGCQLAIVRAKRRVFSLLARPGNNRQSSIAADNSPPWLKAVRIAAASDSETTNIARTYALLLLASSLSPGPARGIRSTPCGDCYAVTRQPEPGERGHENSPQGNLGGLLNECPTARRGSRWEMRTFLKPAGKLATCRSADFDEAGWLSFSRPCP